VPSKSRKSLLAGFRDSHAGVPGQKAIWMQAPWRVTEYTIRGKVVAPPSPGRGESCESKCLWQVPTPKGVPNAKLTSCGWFLDAKGEGGGFPKSGPW
jgi:hypothetical protein